MVDFQQTAFEQHSACARRYNSARRTSESHRRHRSWYARRARKRSPVGRLCSIGQWPTTTTRKKRRCQTTGINYCARRRGADAFAVEQARAEGNVLSRELIALPPNELTPKNIAKAARQQPPWGGSARSTISRSRQDGAGAFVAVAQGSSQQDAAIVHPLIATGKADGRFGR